MSTAIDQKSYLQKYLGGPSKEKKKKKKKAIKGKGFKIIDDDIDLTKLRPLEGDELDILDDGEDAPQIAGIVDERPEEIKKLEQFKTSSKWRVVNQDDGFNSKLQIEEIQKDIKEVEKENEVIFGKMYSDSEDEKQKNDSDISPPRKKSSRNDDSDISPPRKRDQSLQKKQGNDQDISPPRKQEARKERARKPSRWADADPNDVSPTRNYSKSNRSPSQDFSPSRKRNISPQNSTKNKFRSPSSDMSPPRKNDRWKSPETHKSSKDSYKNDRRDLTKRNKTASYKDKKRQDSDSDLSPIRKDRERNAMNKNMSKDKRNRSSSPRNKRKQHGSDSDLSPPRKERVKRTRSPQTSRGRQDSDSDLSPPRKERSNMTDRDRNMSDRNRNMSDREKYISNDKSRKHRRNSDSPPPTNKKMAKTLEGKMAGLQDAKQLREENEEFRRKEDDVFRRLGDDVSGRNAQAISRKGKREKSEDKQKQKEKAERQKELDAKYKVWSKGLKQVEAQQARVQEFIHEASKPVARHRDDKDLEHSLKQVERDGDPMLKYMREKKRERGELPPERPSYKGSFPPNRFNIRPGYRWDGVDRSSGYENKFFQQQNKRKAQEEEAYKWSTEDL